MARTLKAVAAKVGLDPLATDLHARWRYARSREPRESNDRVVAAGAPDGLPLPPPYLAYKVSHDFDLQQHLNNGALGVECIERVLREHGIDLGSLGSVLDWGCGCGRIVRHLERRLAGRLHGCDYNPKLVRWCRSAFSFGRFEVCRLEPPLPYPDASFDLVYAISVLTHTPRALQVPWLVEIRRVLRPGGHALLSVHGASRTRRLGVADRARFERGELVVVAERHAGTNLCGAFHPEAYLRGELGAVMPLIAHLPDAARDARQDLLLFRKD